jgi:hypothetical protein
MEMRLGYRLRCGVSLSLALIAPSALEAQPGIEHEEVGCLSRAQFTRFAVAIRPPEEIREARLYFRSHLYPEFYFVDLARAEPSGVFQGVLPLPSSDTTRVIYYIEAVDVAFQTSRSEDFDLPVSGDSSCRPGPGGAFFPGGDPGIVVGATRAGLPALPSGFQATGITGFISASGGLAVTGGGGIGAGVAIAAATGAAVGVGVLVAGNEDGNEGTTGGVNSSSQTPTTTTSSAAGNTTSTTTSSAGPSPPPTTTTTTSPAGPTPSSTTTTTAGSPPPTTTTTIPPVTLNACFQWRALGNCQVFFTSCSTPVSAIRTYEWRMLGPPVPDPPATESFTFSFDADPRCRESNDFNHPVRLTVYDELGRSASVQDNISVKPGAPLKFWHEETLGLRFKSHLIAMAAEGNIRGQIWVNGSPLPPSDNGAPRVHHVQVRAGSVVIEAAALTRVPAGTLWELDFSSSEAVVPGSLSVSMGTVASLDARRVVLRLDGDGGERLLLRLETR